MLPGQEGRAGFEKGSLTLSQEDASEPQGRGLWMQGFGGVTESEACPARPQLDNVLPASFPSALPCIGCYILFYL